MSLIRTLILFDQGPILTDLITSFEAPFPNTATLGVGASTCELGGGHIYSRTYIQ